ncbi:GntR family transcriptional regulator [Frigoribacterium sp. PhB160]|uniref:FadR/GntR family transcriptional regulator n=1 Tax=Frigoribacterium sp. PhB160 TaxID=2485192 RepID=UPI000FAAEFD9|nr:FCD domain-containing protein [Frigoribacterium sp. PhB160]ROS59631.1 GntR family transcriptional regulator [Frigoribacterium sp. PhB160]
MIPGLPSSRDRGLHARVIDAVGQEIVDATLPPGSILNLEQLGVRFSVSRSVLREAVRVLQSLGMVEPRQRTGTTVLPRSSWDLMNPQVIEWRGRGPEYFTQMRELLELRLGIEPVAARLGAAAMDELQASLVQAAARTMVEAGTSGDGRRYLEADIAFHTALLHGSGNQVLGHFATQVEALLRTRVEEKRFTITGWTPAAAERHLAVADALAARDAETAGAIMTELIQGTVDEFVAEAGGRA